MALHIVYNTQSLKESILKAVNLGGDADTLGAVTGTLAGAIYGIDFEFINNYYNVVSKWDENKALLRAYKLFHKQNL